ncbi:hypothetical protein M405DRAFT_868787 [Rhizopogon salebrosus TDB-379]|nr:hypothetical protein M405DRAFT_868787 [Rhizopogon salebrosus TDB-379]
MYYQLYDLPHTHFIINAICFSQDCRLLASGDDDGYIRLLDIRLGKESRRLMVANAVTSLLWHPNNHNIIFIGGEKQSDSGGHWAQGIQGELKVAELPVDAHHRFYSFSRYYSLCLSPTPSSSSSSNDSLNHADEDRPGGIFFYNKTENIPIMVSCSVFARNKGKQKSHEHYVSATSKVLAIIDDGVQNRVMKNGETLVQKTQMMNAPSCKSPTQCHIHIHGPSLVTVTLSPSSSALLLSPSSGCPGLGNGSICSSPLLYNWGGSVAMYGFCVAAPVGADFIDTI